MKCDAKNGLEVSDGRVVGVVVVALNDVDERDVVAVGVGEHELDVLSMC